MCDHTCHKKYIYDHIIYYKIPSFLQFSWMFNQYLFMD